EEEEDDGGMRGGEEVRSEPRGGDDEEDLAVDDENPEEDFDNSDEMPDIGGDAEEDENEADLLEDEDLPEGEEMEGEEQLDDEEDELKPLDYDGDEEEPLDDGEEGVMDEDDDEVHSRRSVRSSDAMMHHTEMHDDSSNDDEDEEEEEEDEEGAEYDYDDEEKHRSKEDHPTLLASSHEGIIHVGSEYQATIAETDGKSAREDEDRDTAMWLPPPGGLDEDGLMEFCEEAMGIYMLSFDRALYILQKNDYNFKQALETIASRKTIREEWADGDNLLFRQAFCLYGKNFARIRQTMPHRSMSSIIHHYYSTKKQQDYKSLIETKIEKSGFNDEGEHELEGGKCENCHEQVKRLFLIDESKQCNTCMLYFKLMLKMRPMPKEELPEGSGKRRGLKIPEDYMDIVDDFVTMAEQLPAVMDGPSPSKKGRVESVHMSVCVFQTEKTKVHQRMRDIEDEMMRCRARTVRIEHAIKQQRSDLADRTTFDKLKAQMEKEKLESERGRVRMQYTWTEQEKITAFHCFVRYGRDFEAVAEVLGTKTPDMVKSFYSDLKEDVDKIIDEAEEADAQTARQMDRNALLRVNTGPIVVVDLD
ncbi:hypothetical protein PFISCL1PPCAC_966, partial [Pristionchus fissidentatus]